MNEEQANRLRELLDVKAWEIDTIQYARFRARKNKTTVTAYESGKVTVQGKGTAEVVQFVIEPEILMEARFGYETELAREENPEMFEPHAGLDESGKGDFFGPMVIACVYVDEESATALADAGVQDSKAIKSDKKIKFLAGEIRRAVKGKFAIVRIGPSAYNRMYGTMNNVNRMLGWGHARALEDLLEKQSDCPRAVADQFAHASIIERALKEKGKGIKLEQRHKAESDIAVAAASILAREGFIDQMQKLGDELGMTLPRGASAQVVETASRIIRQRGEDALGDYAKLHFRTAGKAADLAASAPDTDFNETPDTSAESS